MGSGPEEHVLESWSIEAKKPQGSTHKKEGSGTLETALDSGQGLQVKRLGVRLRTNNAFKRLGAGRDPWRHVGAVKEQEAKHLLNPQSIRTMWGPSKGI